MLHSREKNVLYYLCTTRVHTDTNDQLSLNLLPQNTPLSFSRTCHLQQYEKLSNDSSWKHFSCTLLLKIFFHLNIHTQNTFNKDLPMGWTWVCSKPLKAGSQAPATGIHVPAAVTVLPLASLRSHKTLLKRLLSSYSTNLILFRKKKQEKTTWRSHHEKTHSFCQ